MSDSMQDNIRKVNYICSKYKNQLKQLTQKLDAERLNFGMEQYYLTQKISDFKILCEKNGVDFSIVEERDLKRRHIKE